MELLMRRWIGAIRFAAILLAFSLAGLPSLARAQFQQSGAASVDLSSVETVLREGSELEQQRRWAEALSHYEDALRRHPGLPSLTERLMLARLHYEVARRYADQSYMEAIRQLDPRQAADLYGEILLKIHAHHVDPPNWQLLFDKGTVALQIALREPAFQRQYGVQLDSEQLTQLYGDVQRYVRQWSVQTRQDSRELARRTVQLVEQRTRVHQSALLLEYACAAVASLDDYSAFLTGNQLDEVMSQIEGNFVGLGIELKSDAQALLIVNVIPQGPADRAGLKPGDRIVQVAGQSTSEVSTDAAADLLKGPDGSVVDLVAISAEGATRSMRLRRQVVEVPSVEQVSLIDPQYSIGFLKLTSFQKTTSRDIDAALGRLHREGMRSLIIDVRGNPGGLLTSAVEVADKFLSEGTIVATRGRASGEDFDYKANVVGTWRVPVIVMIDSNSASASEIFAAAIRDTQRGIIVGERSFGKGSVQGIFPLSFGNAGLRITTAKFYGPSKHAISGQGVQPHVLVHSTARPVHSGNVVARPETDPFISAALEVARRQMAQR
jgi:carboxyl-terminal processing protease